jgi:hypothetical protein
VSGEEVRLGGRFTPTFNGRAVPCLGVENRESMTNSKRPQQIQTARAHGGDLTEIPLVGACR